MHEKVDPRLWNLLAGVGLIATGCGSRAQSPDAGVSGESESSGDVPECVVDDDCDVGYSCLDGECEYEVIGDGYQDGYPPYEPECTSDVDCGGAPYGCVNGQCGWVGTAPPDCAGEITGYSLPESAWVLRLTFANVDADEQDELIAVTEDQLLVHEWDEPASKATEREPGPVLAVVASDLDPAPGEDVVLLMGWAGDTWSLHGSDGVGGLGPGVVQPTPLGSTRGLISGNFDDQPSLDLLGWGPQGAFVIRAGETTILDTANVRSAAAFESETGTTGYVLHIDDRLALFDGEGQAIASLDAIHGVEDLVTYQGSFGVAVAYVVRHPDPFSIIRVQSRAASLEPLLGERGIPAHELSRAGDLDGDGLDELIFSGGYNPVLEFDPLGVNDCLAVPGIRGGGGPWQVAAVGDHDGDGDDELAAFSTGTGAIAVIDGG